MTVDQRLMFECQGFVHLPGVIPPALVKELKAKFDAASAEYEAIWRKEAEAGRAHKGYYDIPHILDKGDCFVDIIDLPTMVPILLEAVGSGIQLNHTHARVFPPGKTMTAPWHSDLADVQGIDLGHSHRFFAKVHYYFEDLRPDQGCLGFIPGSHHLPPEYPRPKIEDIDNSPAVTKIVPKAGDAVLFNTHVLHMALDNTSPLARKSLIYAYSQFWVKNYANSIPSDLDRYATTRLRRQMFGIEEETVSYFDQRIDENVHTNGFDSFKAASMNVIKRLRRAGSITR